MKQIEYKDNSYVHLCACFGVDGSHGCLVFFCFVGIGVVRYVLEIIDTAGTEQFVSMRNLYMKAGEVFVVVYSIVAESTFFETKEIREQILDTKDPVVPPIVLVGNKLDLADERTVSCFV